MKRFILIVLSNLLLLGASAQAPQMDSLARVFRSTKSDSVKVDVLCELSFYEPTCQKGMSFAEQGLALARKIKYLKGEGDCFFQIANHYSGVSNSPMALHYYLEALKIWEHTVYKPGMSAGYVAIG